MQRWMAAISTLRVHHADGGEGTKYRMQRMNIVFACDRGYVQHLSVAMASLFDHCPAGSLNVYVINADLDPLCWGKLEHVNRRHHHNLVNVRISDEGLEEVAASGHYTKTNYHKLFIPEVIPHDKALYLDSDLVVNAPIDDLYATDVEETYLAAVENPGFSRHHQLQMDPSARYFNSGVMVVNVRKWREEEIKHRVVDFTLHHPEAVVLAEQCGLNSVINGRWKVLPLKYNLQTWYFENSERNDHLSDAVREAMVAPAIVHFTAIPKPWYFMSRDPYRGLYRRYLRKTPFRGYVPPDLTLANVVRRILPTRVKNWLSGRKSTSEVRNQR